MKNCRHWTNWAVTKNSINNFHSIVHTIISFQVVTNKKWAVKKISTLSVKNTIVSLCMRSSLKKTKDLRKFLRTSKTNETKISKVDCMSYYSITHKKYASRVDITYTCNRNIDQKKNIFRHVVNRKKEKFIELSPSSHCIKLDSSRILDNWDDESTLPDCKWFLLRK